MWLFKQYLSSPAEAAVDVWVALLNSDNFYRKGALKSYSTIVQILLKIYVAEDNIAKLDTEVCNLCQESMILEEFSKEVWTGILGYGTLMTRSPIGIICQGRELQDSQYFPPSMSGAPICLSRRPDTENRIYAELTEETTPE